MLDQMVSDIDQYFNFEICRLVAIYFSNRHFHPDSQWAAQDAQCGLPIYNRMISFPAGYIYFGKVSIACEVIRFTGRPL